MFTASVIILDLHKLKLSFLFLFKKSNLSHLGVVNYLKQKSYLPLCIFFGLDVGFLGILECRKNPNFLSLFWCFLDYFNAKTFLLSQGSIENQLSNPGNKVRSKMLSTWYPFQTSENILFVWLVEISCFISNQSKIDQDVYLLDMILPQL